MPDPSPSLWRQIPAATRIELVPILTTAILVQAGSSTAEIITRISHWTPFDTPANPEAVSDLTGLLLLLNFAVVLWFAWRTLREALEKSGDIVLNAKLIGLATAFLTVADLYSYATKSGHPDRLAFGLLVLFYAFVLPFFVIRPVAVRFEDDDAAEQGRRAAGQAAGALALLLFALVPCVVTVLACSLYFAILNDGVQVAGADLVPALVRVALRQEARTEYWGFSPGVLGIGWLPAILATAVFHRPAPDRLTLKIRTSGRAVLLLGTAGLCGLLAIAVVSDSSLVLGRPSPGIGELHMAAAKGFLGIALPCAFLAAFTIARTIDRQGWPAAVGIPTELAMFASAGAVAGFILIELRVMLGTETPFAPVFIAIHAGGFAVAYTAGRLSLRALHGCLPGVMPVIGTGAWSRQSKPTS